MSGLYYEEFKAGQQFKHEVRRESDNLLFCALTHNLQPLHLMPSFREPTANSSASW
jgi:acyl dehydratase